MPAFEQRDEDPPQFGEMLEGRAYARRPGAYGVALDKTGNVLVIEVESGLFLPGGGLHDGESNEQALRREILEETGFEIEIHGEIGSANQFVTSAREGRSFNKIGAFFLIGLGQRVGPPSEPDHGVLWLPANEAAARLREENHRWALARAIASHTAR